VTARARVSLRLVSRSPDPEGGARPRVLIADDDPDVRAVLSTQLAPAFDVVATAADTDEAIALAAARQADIAIVDVQMPGGGVRATAEIRAAAPGTTIVALSADESERVVLEMLKAGAVTYIRKGVGAEELTALLRESLRAQAQLPGRDRAS
jgi:two-component system, NarL family, nitrate/nitrite response regulator NarL